jgi:type I restriction enzyme, S subunit
MRDSRLDIPNAANWPERPLAEVCSLISRGTAPIYVERSDVRAVGQRCVTASGFDASRARQHSDRAMSSVLRPEAGDVLLNSTGTGTIGRSCVFDGAGAFMVDGHVTDIRPSPDHLTGQWLNAILRSSWGQRHLERFCFSGSTNQVELNRPSLIGTRIPIPPVDEQRVSAAILGSLDTTIRQTEAVIEKLKQVKQGLLHDLLTRGIDANGELRPPQSRAPYLYKDSPLGWIPREWDVAVLQELTEPDSPITYGVVKPGPEVDGGVPFVRGGRYLWRARPA